MAFPDDYKRVQFSGGVAADVQAHLGLPRQVIIDTTNLNLRLMDGTTAGGHTVQMVKDLDANIQGLNNMEGEVEYVETGTDTPGQADQKRRLWKASKLRNLFLKIADITLVESTYIWSIKNTVLPTRIRTNATLVNDPNTATMTGWTRVAPGSVNLPADAPSAGSLNLMMETVSQSESDLVQILYSRTGDGKIWMRSRSEGNWADWALATGLTSVDLNTRVAKAGDSMTGQLILATSTNLLAGLRLLAGDDKTTPEDGDIWRNAATGIRFRKGGVTRTILDSDNGVAFVQSNAKSFGTGQTYKASSKSWATTYQNTEDKPIMITAQMETQVAADADVWIGIGATSTTLSSAVYTYVPATPGSARTAIVSALIPPGHFYSINRGGTFGALSIREVTSP